MPATYDIKATIGRNRKQTTRRVEWPFRVDFSDPALVSGLAAGESAEVFVLPAGYVHERVDLVLRTAEGAAGNFDLGIEGDLDGFADGADANGTPNASIALAGTESLAPGSYFHTDTPVWINIAAAQPTLDAAVVDVTFVGYLTDTV